jgi:hypothetical protein
VRVRLGRTTPRNLTLDGSAKPVFSACWTNLAADKPQLLRMRIDLTRQGGIASLTPLGPATLQTRAVLSTTLNRGFAAAQWIAWIEDRKLAALPFVEEAGPGPAKLLDLPGDRHELVAPLFCDPGGPDAAGAALVCLGNRDQAGAQVLLVTRAALVPGARLAIPGEFPSWLASHVNSKGVRRLLFLQQQPGDKLSLFACAWPGYADPPGPPRKLATWDGAYVAAASFIDYDDNIIGVVCRWTGNPQARRLVADMWRLDAAERVTQVPAGDLGYDFALGLTAATARLASTGHWGVLLRSRQGDWRYYDPIVKLKAPPAPWDQTRLPIDLAFYKQDEPVFLCGQENMGLQFIKLDGSPLRFKLR